MKKRHFQTIIALLLAAVMLISTPGTVLASEKAAQNYIIIKADNVTLNRHGNFCIVQLDSGKYVMMDSKGNVISAEYSYMENCSYMENWEIKDEFVLVYADKDKREGINYHGLLNKDGKEIIPPIYGYIKVVSEKWQIGINLEEVAESQDYFRKDYHTNKYYDAVSADIYYEETYIGTLDAEAYVANFLVEAFGDYLRVGGKEKYYHFYNNKLELSPLESWGSRLVDTSGYKDYGDEFFLDYFNGERAYYHSGTGQIAYVPECTLTAEEVRQSYLYVESWEDNATYVLDLQGKVVATLSTPDGIWLEKIGDKLEYVKKYDRNAEKYGILNFNDEEIFPAIYDRISCSEEVVKKYGIFSAELDGKFCYLNAVSGKQVCEAKYPYDYGDYHTYCLAKHDGIITVISGLAGELPGEYQKVDGQYGSYAFIGRDSSNQTTLVDIEGHTLIPYDPNYIVEDVSHDGTVALVKTRTGYRIYSFDDEPEDESAVQEGLEKTADIQEETEAVNAGYNEEETVDEAQNETETVNAAQNEPEDGNESLPAAEAASITPASGEAAPAPFESQGGKGETWTCSNGHAGNTGGFCPECGEARLVPPMECPECHIVFPEGVEYKFCPNCGLNLS